MNTLWASMGASNFWLNASAENIKGSSVRTNFEKKRSRRPCQPTALDAKSAAHGKIQQIKSLWWKIILLILSVAMSY